MTKNHRASAAPLQQNPAMARCIAFARAKLGNRLQEKPIECTIFDDQKIVRILLRHRIAMHKKLRHDRVIGTRCGATRGSAKGAPAAI
jgi:hypothetical protein